MRRNNVRYVSEKDPCAASLAARKGEWGPLGRWGSFREQQVEWTEQQNFSEKDGQERVAYSSWEQHGSRKTREGGGLQRRPWFPSAPVASLTPPSPQELSAWSASMGPTTTPLCGLIPR